MLSKENSAARRMTDVDGVMESLRRRVAELQGKLEVEMATAAQLPDALDQVHGSLFKRACWGRTLTARRFRRRPTAAISCERRWPSARTAWARPWSR
jgi:hypothetical protein